MKVWSIEMGQASWMNLPKELPFLSFCLRDRDWSLYGYRSLRKYKLLKFYGLKPLQRCCVLVSLEGESSDGIRASLVTPPVPASLLSDSSDVSIPLPPPPPPPTLFSQEFYCWKYFLYNWKYFVFNLQKIFNTEMCKKMFDTDSWSMKIKNHETMWETPNWISLTKMDELGWGHI